MQVKYSTKLIDLPKSTYFKLMFITSHMLSVNGFLTSLHIPGCVFYSFSHRDMRPTV